MKVYLAGPMRGYPKFNFDRFEEVTQDLTRRGFEVRSPHAMDLEIGFDPENTIEANKFSIEDAVRRDVEAIIWAEGIVMMEKWEASTGATAEWHVAKWLGRPILLYSEICANNHQISNGSKQEQCEIRTLPEASDLPFLPVMT